MLQNSLVRSLIALTLSIFSLVISLNATAESSTTLSAHDQQVNQLLTGFQSGKLSSKEIAKTVKWSGISDEKLFDVLAASLPASLVKREVGVRTIDTAWTLQALGASGLEKYRKTLINAKTFGFNKKIKNNGIAGLIFLDQFKEWNPIISANLEHVNKEDLNYSRIKNMIEADDYLLVRAGASRISNKHYDEQRYIDLILPIIESEYLHVEHKSDKADAIAWMLKVIGNTTNKDYIPLLEKIKKDSPAKSLRRWAGMTIFKIQEQLNTPDAYEEYY